MDWVVVYTIIFWVIAIELQLAVCMKKRIKFSTFIMLQLLDLPIYGRIFGWW